MDTSREGFWLLNLQSWWTYFGRFGISTLAAAILVSIFVHKIIGFRRKSLPPGPWPLPIVGNFLSLHDKLGPYIALDKVAAKYGDLVYLRLGSFPCVVVSSADVARQVAKNNDQDFLCRPEGILIEKTGPDGFKTMSSLPYGDAWRNLRKICTVELFTKRRLAFFEQGRAEELREMLKDIQKEAARGLTVNLRDKLGISTLNIMTRMLLNKRVFVTGDEEHQREFHLVHNMISTALELSGTFVIGDFVPYLTFITKMQSVYKRAERHQEMSIAICHKFTRLDERRRALELNPDKIPDDFPKDFVDVLLSSKSADGKGRLDDDTIIGMMLEMLIAGTDTSATVIEWGMAELVRNPNILKRAQEELDSVVGTDRLVEESDLPNLPYLQALVKECFRLHAPGPLGVPRKSVAPLKLGEYTLPANTRLIFNLATIHRDSRVYESPLKFDPERFLKNPDINVGPNEHFELLPFGFGRRSCPGQPLASTVVLMTIANLCQAFSWALPEDQDPHTLDMSEDPFGLVLTRKNPLMVVAKPRKVMSSVTI
ncbi:hypothetical protein M758_9G098800 [Ceratodon purpureus]|nr:hypothetical protein M758_9G098800 [Ceratodon purpureus]